MLPYMEVHLWLAVSFNSIVGFVCMYVCMCVYTYVRTYVCMYVWMDGYVPVPKLCCTVSTEWESDMSL